jgi:hypothetical protein
VAIVIMGTLVVIAIIVASRRSKPRRPPPPDYAEIARMEREIYGEEIDR